jgi:hypothetical protein
MMIDHAALKSEIDADPQKLGYGPLVKAGNDSGLAALLNAPIPGATCPLDTVPKDDFLVVVQEMVPRLLTAEAAIQQKWGTILPLLLMLLTASGPTVRRDKVAASVGMAIADGLMKQEEADAPFTKSDPSRAEILWGAGTVVAVADVSFALRGAR